MILYFSATGNSEYIAKYLADLVNDEAVSLNDYLKKKEVLNEVLYQVEVCEGLTCPVELETIIDWLRNKTVREIENEARRLKFAS